ncbi:Outer membrane efflux protein [Pseudooctadecabacter jejudonensis]|uniref:Outer membrane efflux protein n=2 Tax=Pseudooctadecabacter jejudonensis TaxID=1391910 RepID=A0A1Y5T642_9RHOB|nr:Outer membrane efflux protein [Pseudooctadecabacter jejudonensis]
MCTGACTLVPIPTDPELDPVAAPLIERSDPEMAGDFNLLVEQPDPYAAIIAQNFDELRFLFEGNARQLQLSNFGSQQIRYPQFRPGAQLRSTGSASLTINVSQSLYDGGAASAQQYSGQTAAIAREIENLAELTDEVAEDINFYLDYHRNLKTISILREFSRELEDLLDLANTRRSGGIGRANEVSLFEFQLAEVQTDIAIAQSSAELALARLSNLDAQLLQIPPRDLNLLQDRIPLSVMEALAERENQRSALEVARSNARPQVTAVASAGFDPATGLPTDNLGIDVSVNDPITIGGNTNLRIAEEDLRLAELQLEDAKQDAQLRIRQILQEVNALQAQQVRAGALASQARNRLAGFEDLFLAGEANITDAVSLIDTVQATTESQIDLEFQLKEAQLELARLSGSLIPAFE